MENLLYVEACVKNVAVRVGDNITSIIDEACGTFIPAHPFLIAVLIVVFGAIVIAGICREGR